jgi:hypothetical protein
VLAIEAGSIGAAEPGNANPRAGGQIGGGSVYHFADDLMARNHVLVERRKLAFHDVQIGTANSAGTHAQQNLPGAGLRFVDVGNTQRVLRDALRRGKERGFHLNPSGQSILSTMIPLR